jgi:hypothetical protein
MDAREGRPLAERGAVNRIHRPAYKKEKFMHVAEAKRVGEITKDDRPDHLVNLPEDTHLVSGVLEGNGATALASEKAKLSAKTVKLTRTAGGGVEYQFAIFVSEPIQVVKESEPVKAPPTDEEKAIAYFVEKGMKFETAKKQVERFGVKRVLDQLEAELDQELQSELKKVK